MQSNEVAVRVIGELTFVPELWMDEMTATPFTSPDAFINLVDGAYVLIPADKDEADDQECYKHIPVKHGDILLFGQHRYFGLFTLTVHNDGKWSLDRDYPQEATHFAVPYSWETCADNVDELIQFEDLKSGSHDIIIYWWGDSRPFKFVVEGDTAKFVEVVDQPIAWYWEGKNGCTHFAMDGPNVQKFARELFSEPKPLFSAPQPAELLHAYPEKLTDNLRDALSMMMWNTGPIASLLRVGGADIPRKAELEQAHVLHWTTHLVLKHGDDWRKIGDEHLKSIRDAANAEAARLCGLAGHEVP